jgi:hypothetical protein
MFADEETEKFGGLETYLWQWKHGAAHGDQAGVSFLLGRLEGRSL